MILVETFPCSNLKDC